ncbi:hypothetical protein FOZ60_004624 [Perkinsus olseni]|uniref:Uncharacterized protein n=1 Tax=Perkinsus olseni TaxID=32597 RepID=A0A7J6NTV5_PEROL|nr:hypothetical protein FOZ60_004624 [Perkinsus olseni]
MEASGNTQLNFGDEDIYLRLEKVPEKNISYNDRRPCDARMLYASHGVANLLTPWYYIAGSGDTSGINLYSNTVKTSSADHSFSTKQDINLIKLIHYSYHMRFTSRTEGTYRTYAGVQRPFVVEKVVVDGVFSLVPPSS